MEKYNFLVTGHKGFIGSHIFDALSGTKIGIDLKEGEDILDCLPENIEVETVFHLAALPRVEYSVENPFSPHQPPHTETAQAQTPLMDCTNS